MTCFFTSDIEWMSLRNPCSLNITWEYEKVVIFQKFVNLNKIETELLQTTVMMQYLSSSVMVNFQIAGVIHNPAFKLNAIFKCQIYGKQRHLLPQLLLKILLFCCG